MPLWGPPCPQQGLLPGHVCNLPLLPEEWTPEKVLQEHEDRYGWQSNFSFTPPLKSPVLWSPPTPTCLANPRSRWPSYTKTISALAVAEARAQVCVAGLSLFSSLHIRPALLQRQAGLSDMADLQLKCLGSTLCRVSLGGRSTLQDISFVQLAKNFYLSLDACKGLGLVPPTFPNSVAHVLVEETSCKAAPPCPHYPTNQAAHPAIHTAGGERSSARAVLTLHLAPPHVHATPRHPCQSIGRRKSRCR